MTLKAILLTTTAMITIDQLYPGTILRSFGSPDLLDLYLREENDTNTHLDMHAASGITISAS